MLVDDDEDIRALCQTCLATLGGFEVSLAASGAEALERASVERPDLIILDMMMPGMDGLDTLARLRLDPRTTPIPVVMLTAALGGAATLDLSAQGCAGVIRKPFNPLELAAEVRRITEPL